MSTFSENMDNNVAKDNPTPEDVKAADAVKTDVSEVPADDPNKPTELLDEGADATADRHVASTELTVGDLTHPETQGDSALAEDAKTMIVPGAATGPDDAGVVRNDHGKVAYAPPGSRDAANNGVQQDASGNVDSVGTDNSSASGTRI